MADVLAETKLSPEKGDPLDRVILSTPRGHHGHHGMLESGGEADGLELPQASLSPDTSPAVLARLSSSPDPGAAPVPRFQTTAPMPPQPMPPLQRPRGGCVTQGSYEYIASPERTTRRTDSGQVVRRQRSLGASASSATLSNRHSFGESQSQVSQGSPSASASPRPCGIGLTSSASAASFGQGSRPGSARNSRCGPPAASDGGGGGTPSGSARNSFASSPGLGSRSEP